MPSLSDLINYAAPVASSVVGGIVGSRAAGQATRALTQGGQQAINTIQGGQQTAQNTLSNIWGQQQGILNPFVTAGQGATTTLAQGVQPGGSLVQPFSWTPDNLANDPAYQFRLQQGQKAIEAGANAGGTRFSGATLKDLNQFATGQAAQAEQQDYERQFGTYKYNQQTQLDALQNLQQQGLSAANSEVAAGTGYGTNTANLQVGTSKAIADLQTQIASATAAGDIAKANQLKGTLDGITSGLQQGQILNSLNPSNATPFPNFASPGANPQAPAGASWQSLMPEAAGATPAELAASSAGAGAAAATGPGAAAAIPGTALGATGALAAPSIAAPALSSLGAVAGGAVPELSTLPAIGLAPDLGVGAAATSGAAGSSGGLVSSLTGFMTNPWTIGIAGAIIAGAAILKATQVHPTADKWVQQVQNPFGKNLGTIVDHFDSAIASGQLTKADAQTLHDQTKALIDQYVAAEDAFAAKGSKEAQVIKQAKATDIQYAGPNWDAVLGKQQRAIDAMAG